MKESLKAIEPRGANLLSFRWTVPAGCCRDCASVGGKADIATLAAILLPDELSDVPFSGVSHLGCTSIADMGVVGPNYQLCRGLLAIEMVDQCI